MNVPFARSFIPKHGAVESRVMDSLAVCRDQFICRVAANISLCREHFRLVLRTDSFPPTEPGQFVQVSCRDLDVNYSPETELDWREGEPLGPVGQELMAPLALLRRPFSLAGRVDRADGSVELHLIQRVVGIGTDWLGKLQTGDTVNVLGPLGNRFTLPSKEGTALLVGGGVGIPPMMYLAEKLAGRKAVVFAGALTRDLLPFTITDDAGIPTADGSEPLFNVAEFAQHGVPAVLTTDDGSYGFRGFVTQALEGFLDREFPDSALSPRSSGLPTIYTCGPEPMMKRVAAIAATRGLECQVAVERAMACGMGTCQSCCIKVRKPDPAAVPLPGKDWCWRLACTDGPVFRGADLLW
jgi:dihydroorotate dehydrogenase electron transfer subunit